MIPPIENADKAQKEKKSGRWFSLCLAGLKRYRNKNEYNPLDRPESLEVALLGGADVRCVVRCCSALRSLRH